MDSRSAFAAEGDALTLALQAVPATDFDRVTNCPPWTLNELVVHIASSVRLSPFADAPADSDVKQAADYYRRAERDTAEYHDNNVRRTQKAAARMLATRSAASCFDETFSETREVLNGANPDRVIEVDGVGAMRFGDWLTTRVIALAAHGLDVAITVGSQPWTTPQAHEVMRPVFLSLLDTVQPAEWDDLRFLAVATGRAQLTSEERTRLGEHAGRFPLLS